MTMLPAPRDTLAGVIWLPRILAKARLVANGELASEYAARFGAPDGVDGQFLPFFKLTREELVAAPPDAAAWFLALPTASPARIAEWNRIALDLGRPGFPLAERLLVALDTSYAHLRGHGVSTVFELLEADEGRPHAPSPG